MKKKDFFNGARNSAIMSSCKEYMMIRGNHAYFVKNQIGMAKLTRSKAQRLYTAISMTGGEWEPVPEHYAVFPNPSESVNPWIAECEYLDSMGLLGGEKKKFFDEVYYR